MHVYSQIFGYKRARYADQQTFQKIVTLQEGYLEAMTGKQSAEEVKPWLYVQSRLCHVVLNIPVPACRRLQASGDFMDPIGTLN